MRQKTQLELAISPELKGEAPRQEVGGTEACAANAALESQAVVLGPSMEAIVERDNLKKALAQVKRNKGAPGVDAMRFDELASYLKSHWPAIRAQLLDGTYKPQPVRRVEIPKATGGTRPPASRRFSTASSSKRCCKCFRRRGTGRSPRRASALDRGARRIRR
jgi:RNA-directed DNA polymerase